MSGSNTFFCRAGLLASVLVIVGCGTPIQYVMGANPAVTSNQGKWTQGSSCAIRILIQGFTFGGARADAAIDDAVRRANQRDKLPQGEQYDSLVDAELKFVRSAFGECYEASGYPARLGIADGSAGTASVPASRQPSVATTPREEAQAPGVSLSQPATVGGAS